MRLTFPEFESMIRKSMPSGHDPMGGNRFSENIMLKQKDARVIFNSVE
jgi:hypothetical protein